MLTSKVASTYLDKVRKSFRDIGHKNGTATPPTQSNLDPVAWEVYLSTELERQAKIRRDNAIKHAIETGVMFDHKEKPLPPGTEQTIYNGEIVQVSVRVNNASNRFDHGKLKGVLLRHGVSADEVDSIYEECMVEGAASHSFRATPIVTAG